LSNPGQSALSLSSITASGDFAQTNTCGSSLAGGTSCSISVRFSPKAVGPRSASLTIRNADPTSPQKMGLSGTGQ
jgi:hypothetical protein